MHSISMNIQLTIIAILLFGTIFAVKAVEADPGIKIMITEAIEIQVQNLLSNMIGEELVFSNLNTQDLMKELYVVEP